MGFDSRAHTRIQLSTRMPLPVVLMVLVLGTFMCLGGTSAYSKVPTAAILEYSPSSAGNEGHSDTISWSLYQRSLLEKWGIGTHDLALPSSKEAQTKLLIILGGSIGLPEGFSRTKIVGDVPSYYDTKRFTLNAAVSSNSGEYPLYISLVDKNVVIPGSDENMRGTNSIIYPNALYSFLSMDKPYTIDIEFSEKFKSEYKFQEYMIELEALNSIIRKSPKGIFFFNFGSIEKMSNDGVDSHDIDEALAYLKELVSKNASITSSPLYVDIVSIPKNSDSNNAIFLRQITPTIGRCDNPTQRDCVKNTRNCSGNGTCMEVALTRTASCYVCKCRKNDGYDWAGDSCQFKDISTTFNLFFWTTIGFITVIVYSLFLFKDIGDVSGAAFSSGGFSLPKKTC